MIYSLTIKYFDNQTILKSKEFKKIPKRFFIGGLMELNQIKELVSIMESSTLDSLEVETNDIKIKMGKLNYIENINKSGKKTLGQEKGFKETKNEINKNEINKKEMKNIKEEKQTIYHEGLIEVKSPMVGTFYLSSSPESPPYVRVGDRVKKGDILCIVEAMKVMNEIEAEEDGEIIEVLASNESPVEYGQVLFRVKGA